jgi:pSer/pThr/pTyr-binding forkhead associated (FHA) protein
LRVLPSPEKQNRNIQVVAEFSQDQSGKTDYFIADQSPVNSLGAFLIVDGKQLFLLSDVVTNIGRLNENHLIIADGRVSRRHAQIRFVQDHYVIFDLGSSGGTYVNNVRITQSILNPGDIISLAGVAIVFGMEDHERFMANTQKLSPIQE